MKIFTTKRIKTKVAFFQRMCAIYQYHCAKNGKGFKIGTKEADTIEINDRVGGILKD